MSSLTRPATAPSKETSVSAARVALGRALAARVTDVGDIMARQWRQSSNGAATWSAGQNDRIAQDIMRIGSFATTTFSKYLVTGDPTTPEEDATWKGQGTVPLHGIMSLAELTKLNLDWRSAIIEVIYAEAGGLGTDAATVAEAVDVARAGCDASLVGMAKHFDVEQRRLQSELAAGQARLTHQQLHDPLTGLANRTLLLDRLSHALMASKRRETAVAVLFVDMDHFKSVNDAVGHSSGDGLLMQVARRLQKLVRPTDTAARFGSDEFVLLCEDLTAPQTEAAAVAERVIEALSEPFAVAARELFASASIGIAIGRPGDDAEVVMSQADAAMHLAKRRGRARHVLYEPAIDEASSRRAELANALHRTLKHGELQIHYQPVTDLRSQRVVTMEALLRWCHPDLGPVAPVEFIPIAEDTGLIVDIGRWVLETACSDCRAWRDAGHDVGVSINVSGRQLADADLVDDVREALERAGLPPAAVTLELTESILVTSDEGSRVALDGPEGARCAPRDRRLRNRVLLAVVPGRAPCRRPEDRPKLRLALGSRHPELVDDRRGGRAGPLPGTDRHRRRCGDRARACRAAAHRLRPGTGLPTRQAAPAREHRELRSALGAAVLHSPRPA